MLTRNRRESLSVISKRVGKKIIFLRQVRDYGHTRSSNPPHASSNLRVSESATNAGSLQVTHGAEKTRETRDHNLVARITRTNTTNRITRYHGVFLRRDITDKHFHMVTLLAPVSFFFCFKKKEKKLPFRSAEETLLIPGCTCRPWRRSSEKIKQTKVCHKYK